MSPYRRMHTLAVISTFALICGACAHPSTSHHLSRTEYLDGGSEHYEEQDMHACKHGYAMGGADVSGNVFTCRPVVDDPSSEHTQLDSGETGTHRLGVHACPEGWYLRGLKADKNILLCSRIAGITPHNEFKDGDPPTHDNAMHICPPAKGSTVMTGIDNRDNVFLCASE